MKRAMILLAVMTSACSVHDINQEVLDKIHQKAQEQLAKMQCRAAAISPVMQMLTSEDVVSIAEGKFDVDPIMDAMKVAPEMAAQVKRDLKACEE